VLRSLPIAVPPARHELLASYLRRLGNLHGLDPDALRAEVGTPPRLQALAALTGLPRLHLAAALPELRDPGADPAVFRHEPQHGCPRCDGRHLGGRVVRVLPHHRYICIRHSYWIGPPDIPGPPTALGAFPGLPPAQHRHRRLLRRHGPAATYDAVLTGFLICGHLWTATPRTRTATRLKHIWDRRAALLIPDYADFSASRIFAATYPEAVNLAAVLANPIWRRLAHGDTRERERFLAEVGHRLGGPTYTPGENSDAVAHWMSWDAPRPPITAPCTDPATLARGLKFATGKANQNRHDRSRYWFDRCRGGGNVILHHRHVRPVLIRPWSPAMERLEGAIWASTSLDRSRVGELAECAT
jgi:hypothetical protein